MKCDEIEALLARVQAATGLDRELDGQLMACLCPPTTSYGDEPARWFVRFDGDDRGVFKTHALTQASESRQVPAYTRSTDAALALVERVRPDLRVWELGQLTERRGGRYVRAGWSCNLDSLNDEGSIGECDEAATAALAILAALLSALKDQADA